MLKNSRILDTVWNEEERKQYCVTGPVEVQVFVRSQTNATVSSLILSTNYTQSMREGFFGPFPILLNPYGHSFLIN